LASETEVQHQELLESGYSHNNRCLTFNMTPPQQECANHEMDGTRMC
jgi:hypothetical protein